jgi:hypothetical protein
LLFCLFLCHINIFLRNCYLVLVRHCYLDYFSKIGIIIVFVHVNGTFVLLWQIKQLMHFIRLNWPHMHTKISNKIGLTCTQKLHKNNYETLK